MAYSVHPGHITPPGKLVESLTSRLVKTNSLTISPLRTREIDDIWGQSSDCLATQVFLTLWLEDFPLARYW